MCRRLLQLLASVLMVVAAIGVVFLLGMRAKSPSVLNAVRRINRDFSNPRQLKSAGTPGSYAAVVGHVGRVSGRPYETPVGVVATGDGFVIALPYGAGTDWVANVLAAGGATIVHEGRTYDVDRPEVVATPDVQEHFSPGELRTLRLFRVEKSLLLREVAADPEG